MQHYPYQSPKELEALIKKSIIGQDDGVRTVATALAAHLLRIEHNQNHPENLIHKDNLLIIGPTGSGKTESIRTVIRECRLPIPIAVVATNNLTSSGYRGKNLETILTDLYQDAFRIISEDPEKYVEYTEDEEELKERGSEAAVRLANRGIIILDEVDKIRIDPFDRREDSFFQRNLQSQLLKMIEGGSGFGEHQAANKIDTTDILFILSGAFVGLEDITRQRLRPEWEPEPEENKPIGFLAPSSIDGKAEKKETAEPQGELTPRELIPSTEDLVEYGFMPELVGRITLRCRYNPITAEILYNILRESDISPAREFKTFFSRTQNRLEYTNNALMEIARRAEKLQTGVRGLRNIIGDIT
ncbi:MAG: AAA family ATPase, partial [Acidaminococcaceae bacterium]|nr:AAA family ATPase [Acidaminococcaceae bacterium]